MTNGYTYKVSDGTMTSVKDFLLEFARKYGIGDLITNQGGEPMPKKYSPKLAEKAVGDYHAKELELAKKKLESFNKLSGQKLKAMYEEYVAKTVEKNKRLADENAARERRYIDMINKVSKWSSPCELEEMKNDAIKTLEESKDYDCKLYLCDICTYDEWLKSKRESLVWNVNYHTREKVKEDKRRAEFDAMLKSFYQSLESVE